MYRADICRVAMLFEFGGFYFDIDMQSRSPVYDVLEVGHCKKEFRSTNSKTSINDSLNFIKTIQKISDFEIWNLQPGTAFVTARGAQMHRRNLVENSEIRKLKTRYTI